MIYLQDLDFTLRLGDVREELRELPDESVHCVVTSPPYWGLRNYDCEGQLGLEPTPEEYVANMVEVFREVRRVLRKDGTCWLNVGDSYSHGGNGSRDPEKWPKQSRNDHRVEHSKARGGTKPKDLLMLPARVALALQADGWWLRSEITWCKPNPMPESVTDRPTQATEKVYLLTRSPRYFFDQEAVREPYLAGMMRDGFRGENDGPSAYIGQQRGQSNSEKNAGRGPDGRKKTSVQGGDGSEQHRDGERWPNPSGRNLRNWWPLATEPYPDAHFATFPTELVRRCILAGTSERGCCPECGASWVRETDTSYDDEGRTTNGPRSVERRHETAGFGQRLVKSTSTTDWRPSCDHGDDDPFRPEHTVPATVLDPFMGSGTTALVARKHGRNCIGIELSQSYCGLAARRLQQLSLLSEGAA